MRQRQHCTKHIFSFLYDTIYVFLDFTTTNHCWEIFLLCSLVDQGFFVTNHYWGIFSICRAVSSRFSFNKVDMQVSHVHRNEKRMWQRQIKYQGNRLMVRCHMSMWLGVTETYRYMFCVSMLYCNIKHVNNITLNNIFKGLFINRVVFIIAIFLRCATVLTLLNIISYLHTKTTTSTLLRYKVSFSMSISL